MHLIGHFIYCGSVVVVRLQGGTRIAAALCGEDIELKRRSDGSRQRVLPLS